MHESDLKRIYINPIYPRGSTIYSDKGFVNIEDGSLRGTHWVCFIAEDKKSFYFDSFGSSPDIFLPQQIT